MGRSLLLIVSWMVLFSVQNVHAQSFCQELQNSYADFSQAEEDLRTDSFDVQMYSIHADFRGYTSDPAMTAYADVHLIALQDLSQIRLDLLSLEVTQVEVDGQAVSFTHTSPSLKILLSAQAGDTLVLTVHYRGKPSQDAQWGGFHFSGVYAYNLGVGFAANPHNFGRVWFPCVDNFRDRARYNFWITVDSGFKAYCNGDLAFVARDTSDGSNTFMWNLEQSIPTYLASVAIAPYEEISYMQGDQEVTLTALAKDTADVRAHFIHLPECIEAFDRQFGPDAFGRVGFNVVPFNGGAMEHATNIAYPYFAIRNGSLDYETLYAHELAHHWWGNAVTCGEASDMWLNEGWASFSERIFLETVYGRDAYKEAVRANHYEVLQRAHLRDGEALPVAGVDHANTYGSHVYKKGADMVHTLRGFMGDTAFFDACRAYQDSFRFRHARTEDLERFFQRYTQVDLEPFFRQWIRSKGFAHYFIQELASDPDTYRIRIKQTQKLTNAVYEDAVHYLGAFSASMELKEFKVLIPSNDDWIEIPRSAIPFEPVYWALDPEERVSDAVTDQWAVLDSLQAIDWPDAEFNAKLTQLTEPILLRVEHHWAGPDQYFLKIPGLAMSTERYWSLEGIWGEGSQLDVEFFYNGQRPVNPAFGYLDDQLIRITEDSLVLLYRPNAHSDWQVHPNFTKTMGSVFDKKGKVLVSDAQPGQYAFGMYDAQLLSGVEALPSLPSVRIYPNPADDVLNVELQGSHDCCYAEVTDAQGRSVLRKKVGKRSDGFTLDVSDWVPGVYYLGLIDGTHAYDPLPFVIR